MTQSPPSPASVTLPLPWSVFACPDLFSTEKRDPIVGNESSDTQIGVEEASDGANAEVDLDAAYPSDSTQDAFE